MFNEGGVIDSTLSAVDSVDYGGGGLRSSGGSGGGGGGRGCDIIRRNGGGSGGSSCGGTMGRWRRWTLSLLGRGGEMATSDINVNEVHVSGTGDDDTIIASRQSLWGVLPGHSIHRMP